MLFSTCTNTQCNFFLGVEGTGEKFCPDCKQVLQKLTREEMENIGTVEHNRKMAMKKNSITVAIEATVITPKETVDWDEDSIGAYKSSREYQEKLMK